jgi:hypothetical protein
MRVRRAAEASACAHSASSLTSIARSATATKGSPYVRPGRWWRQTLRRYTVQRLSARSPVIRGVWHG